MRTLRPAAVSSLLVLDRVTKLWALERLRGAPDIPLLPFFGLSYVENTGAAFGMGRGSNGLFIAISIAMSLYLLRALSRWPKEERLLQAGGTLVLAGALGNLYDRVAYGFVVDFLHLSHWPVFNVADSCISVGACLLAWRLKDEDKRPVSC